MSAPVRTNNPSLLITGCVLKRIQTHVDEVFAEALLEVAKEGHLCGFIQKHEILDPDPVPGSQGSLHVQLTLCNKFSFKSVQSALLRIEGPFCMLTNTALFLKSEHVMTEMFYTLGEAPSECNNRSKFSPSTLTNVTG